MLVNMLVNKVSDVIWKGTLHTNGKLNNENMNVRMYSVFPIETSSKGTRTCGKPMQSVCQIL